MWSRHPNRFSNKWLSTSVAINGKNNVNMGWWDHVQPAPKDPITSVSEAFLSDPSPLKLNLGVGAYRDDRGQPVTLECVRRAAEKISGCEIFHHDIWRDSQVCTKTYHYYDPDTKGLQFQALMDDIKNAPDHSFFLLHPCAHNPTGVDPNYEQWKEISHIQGIVSGDLERDATAIRIFLEDGHLLGCAQSFSQNMGLYGHRVGCVSIVSRDEKQATAIKSQLQQIVRAMYSSFPLHGPLLVSTILNDADLKALWEDEVKDMVDRLIRMRITLCRTLEELNSSASWEHITEQVGMFYFSGLSPEEVSQLQRDFHIYD